MSEVRSRPEVEEESVHIIKMKVEVEEVEDMALAPPPIVITIFLLAPPPKTLAETRIIPPAITAYNANICSILSDESSTKSEHGATTKSERWATNTKSEAMTFGTSRVACDRNSSNELRYLQPTSRQGLPA